MNRSLLYKLPRPVGASQSPVDRAVSSTPPILSTGLQMCSAPYRIFDPTAAASFASVVFSPSFSVLDPLV